MPQPTAADARQDSAARLEAVVYHCQLHQFGTGGLDLEGHLRARLACPRRYVVGVHFECCGEGGVEGVPGVGHSPSTGSASACARRYCRGDAVAIELGHSWRHLETIAVLGVWAVAGLLLAPVVLRRMARRESGSSVAARREKAIQRAY